MRQGIESILSLKHAAARTTFAFSSVFIILLQYRQQTCYTKHMLFAICCPAQTADCVCQEVPKVGDDQEQVHREQADEEEDLQLAEVVPVQLLHTNNSY